MYDDDLLTLTPEHLVSACRREGILWLVIVKPKAAQGGEEGTVKLKSVLRGSEEESESRHPFTPARSLSRLRLVLKGSDR